MKPSRLALAVHIFAKCEFIYKNAKINVRAFATFAKQYLVKSTRYNFEICERKLENAKENVHAFATFAKGIRGLARA